MTRHDARPQRAVIYTRISRDDSGEGTANERQREDCEKLADLRRWEVVAVEEDVSISALGHAVRPAYQRVLGMVERGEVDVVVAWHIDRLTRSMTDLQHIIKLAEQHEVVIATVTGDIDLSTDSGRLIAEILTAVAGAEVRRKGARQRSANKQRAAQGLPWPSGWRALGFEKDGTIVEEEAAHIRQAAEDVLSGTSLSEVKRQWGAAGLSTPRSSKGKTGAWTHSGVRSVLLNPRYAGKATYKGEVIGDGAWEPIISAETHTLLVAKLTDPARKLGGPQRFGVPDNLLSGIATCAKCGGPVQAGSGHKGVAIYQCTKYHGSTYREEADAFVRSAFALAVATTGAGRVIPLSKTRAPEELLSRVEEIQGRLSTLSMSFAEGRITIEQLEGASASLRRQQEEVEAQIREAGEAPGDPLSLRSESVRKFLDLDLQGQRRVLSELVEITLYPKGRGRKNVPIKHQVSVYVTNADGRRFPAADEIPQHIKDEAQPSEVAR